MSCVSAKLVGRNAALWTTLFAALAGCDGDLSARDGDAGGATIPCAEPVTITPTTARVAPEGVVVLRASGGTGHYAFSLADTSSSGARIDESSGVFVAGTMPGEDVVVVRDLRCDGQAESTITTTNAFTVAPVDVEVEPGTSFTFRTSGGTGDATFALVRDGSGGSVSSAGAYVAGSVEGEDVVRATDTATGATADAVVTVREGAGVTPSASLVNLPIDGSYVASVSGGSGVFTLSSSAESVVSVSSMELAGHAAGEATIAIEDDFLTSSASFTARAMPRLQADSVYVGDRSDTTRALTRDLDGDGHAEAILAMPQSSLGAVRGGAVFVFRGTADGLDPTPVRTYVGEHRDDNLGTGIAVGDLDGDELPELLIGAWQADDTGSQAGSVYVIPGQATSFFATTVDQTLVGVVSGDRFGLSLAVCDLDGDAQNDVIVGAADSEDRDRTPRLSNQGSIFVFVNVDGNILSTATQTIHGAVFHADGTTTAHDELRFGSGIASGDFDGDGRCDVAVYSGRPDPAVADDGAVSVFRGRSASSDHRGGLEPTPMFFAAAPTPGASTGSRFGRALALGDLDGDGRDELAVGQPLHDNTDADGRAQDQTGAVRLFRGRAPSADGTPFVLTPDEADLTITTQVGNQQVGYAVAIGDVTGDGRADLVSGDARLTIEGSELMRPGAVRVYTAVEGAIPDVLADFTIEGQATDDRLGWVVGALDSDGRGDRVLAYAGLADIGGYDTGRLYTAIASTGGLTPIDLPEARGGRRLGAAVAAADLDDDGFPDLVVGSPLEAFDGTSHAGTALRGVRVGAAHVYRGSASGWPATPSFSLRGFAGHSEDDQLGTTIAPAGDYDGDGIDDLLVTATYEDRTSTLATAMQLDASCEGFATAAYDAGVAYLFLGATTIDGAHEPALALFGPEASRQVQTIAALDFDGDGARDLVYGSSGWSTDSVRTGGIRVVLHRAPVEGAIVGVCDADWALFGQRANDEFGSVLAPLGDVDGDGCDDLAVGAPRTDRVTPSAITDEGWIAIVFGAGASCASTSPVVRWLASGDASSTAGQALAAGDLDGDGTNELVIGAPRFRNGAGEIGRVFVVDGARLAALRSASAVPTTLASVSAAVLEGRAAGERLGMSVAVSRWAGSPVVAMGAPWADISGRVNTGGVRFARWSADALTWAPTVVSGENDEAGTELGAYLSSFRRGTDEFLLVGAPWSNVGGALIHEGAAYLVDLRD